MLTRIVRWLQMHDDRGHLEERFAEELHFQSSRIIIFACLAGLLWLNYISVDAQLHPDKPEIVMLRQGTLILSLIIFLLFKQAYFRARSQFLLLAWGTYLIVGAGYIAGITGNDQAYFAGFMLALCLLPMAPVRRRYAYLLLMSAVVIYLCTSLISGVEFTEPRNRYSFNDLMSAVVAVSFFIFMLDKIRHFSWKNAKLIELESNKKLEKAEAESDAKSRFLATMSHEIRTPMNGVIGMAELLQDTQLDSQQKQYLNVITGSGKALLNIINDILDYSKVEAGKLEIENVEFDLEKLCSEIAAFFSPLAEDKKLDFFIELSSDLPRFVVSDPTRLRQILLNVVGNAFKFTDKGFVKIRVDYVKAKSMLNFIIEDSGIGMSSAQMENLFVAFKQADSSTTRKYAGTGLGLSISKQLANALGGDIWVESDNIQGSTFSFSISIQSVSNVQSAIDCESLNGIKLLLVNTFSFFNDAVEQIAREHSIDLEFCSLSEAFAKVNGGIHYDIVWVCDQNVEENPNASMLYQTVTQINQWAQDTTNQSTQLILAVASDVSSNVSLDNFRIIKMPYTARQIRESLVTIRQRILKVQQNNESNDIANQKIQNTKVLVVEDNPINQLVIKKMLSKMGVESIIANNGFEAFSQFKASSFGLILMDCEMPECDGFESTRMIRQWEILHQKNLKASKIPIVALTAHAMKENIARCLDAGMDDCLSKPIEMKTLREKLLEVLK